MKDYAYKNITIFKLLHTIHFILEKNQTIIILVYELFTGQTKNLGLVT